MQGFNQIIKKVFLQLSLVEFNYDTELSNLADTLPDQAYCVAEKYLECKDFDYSIFSLSGYPAHRDLQKDVLICIYLKYFNHKTLSSINFHDYNQLCNYYRIYSKVVDLFFDGKDPVYLNLLAEISITFIEVIDGRGYRDNLSVDPSDNILTALEVINRKLDAVTESEVNLLNSLISRKILKAKRILHHKKSFNRDEG